MAKEKTKKITPVEDQEEVKPNGKFYSEEELSNIAAFVNEQVITKHGMTILNFLQGAGKPMHFEG